MNVLAALIQDVSRLQKLETELAIQNERYRLLEETSNEICLKLILIKILCVIRLKKWTEN